MDKKNIANIKSAGFRTKWWKANIAKSCQIKDVADALDDLEDLGLDRSGSVQNIDDDTLESAISYLMDLRKAMKKALAKCGAFQKESKQAINNYIKEIDTEHKNCMNRLAKYVKKTAEGRDELAALQKMDKILDKIEKPVQTAHSTSKLISKELIDRYKEFMRGAANERTAGAAYTDMKKWWMVLPISRLKKDFEKTFEEQLRVVEFNIKKIKKNNPDTRSEFEKVGKRFNEVLNEFKAGKDVFQTALTSRDRINKEFDGFIGVKAE